MEHFIIMFTCWNRVQSEMSKEVYNNKTHVNCMTITRVVIMNYSSNQITMISRCGIGVVG